MENNLNTENYKKKPLVIGIGGISRAGKTSVTKFIAKSFNIQKVIQIDKYLIGPIKKFDENLQDYIEDWEDPICYDLDKFYQDLKFEIENYEGVIIAEGFLLFSKKEYVDLIDIKIWLDVNKEVARDRRKRTKHYGSDYYFDDYIWKGFIERK
jgi:uridine kinase